MRAIRWQLLLGLCLLPGMALAADAVTALPAPLDIEFGGYRFGESPAANMTCHSGYCKSQAPGGDGLVTFPYSTYATPGAVSTLAGLAVVNPRYTFWNDRLYRVTFQVECAPLESDACLDDIVKSLDREYSLTPLSAYENRQFVVERHIIVREFITATSAFIKVRAATVKGEFQLPMVDIIDKRMANLVGTSLSPNFKPKKLALPEGFGQP